MDGAVAAELGYLDLPPTPAALLADRIALEDARRLADALERQSDDGLAGYRRRGLAIRLAGAQLLPPVRPRTLICAGNNYRKHAAEMNTKLPSRPGGFLKSPAAVIGTGDPIVIPPDPSVADSIDYEGEFCIVIGRPAYRVSEADALSYVGGYTCGNDVSARNEVPGFFDWMRGGGGPPFEAFSNPQDLVLLGKQYPTFMPLGPAILTADAVPDPSALRITTRVDGEVRQDESTSDLVFGVAELVAYWSRYFALQPGDVISTGSPSGVGISFTPPRFLKVGSRVSVTIDDIGSLENGVIG